VFSANITKTYAVSLFAAHSGKIAYNGFQPWKGIFNKKTRQGRHFDPCLAFAQ